MGEATFRANQFREHLHKIRGKRTWLYGGGGNSRMILRMYGAEYRFCGLIVREEETEEKRAAFADFGVDVMTLEEAVHLGAECIVIAAEMYPAETIYQRIHRQCRERGILLMDLYGFDQIALHDALEAQPFLDLDGWMRRTDGYDVVSFELTDTLIERDLLHSRRGRVRPVFGRLIPALEKKGVRVIFIAAPSDPRKEYASILTECGLLRDPDDLSGRIFVQTWEEAFFREVRAQVPGSRYLHIGHSLLENGIMPRLCGFDTCPMVWFDTRQLTSFYQSQEQQYSPAAVSEEAVRAAIDDAEVVSFDVFDTLLVRETAHFSDIFYLTATWGSEAGILKDGDKEMQFLAARHAVQAADISMEEMYRRIGQRLGLSVRDARRLQAMEMDLERRVIRPRRAVVRLLQYAGSIGKRVVIASDMYFSERQMDALLREKGISGYERIFVSSEYRLSKRDGLLGRIAERLGVQPAEILHLGDSTLYDEEPARRAGIRFLKIPSAGELADADREAGIRKMTDADREAGIRKMADADREAGIRKMADTERDARADDSGGRDLQSRLTFGIWRAERYEDPFLTDGGTRRERLYRYGYTAAAPVMAGYLLWLFSELVQRRPEKVLFAARDGWLLRQLYEKMRGTQFPESVYFYTSRRAAFLLLADREESAGFIADMAEGMSVREVLRQFFGLEDVPEIYGTIPLSGSALIKAVRESRDAIRAMAQRARDGYGAYCESCGLGGGKSYAYVDFVASGTSQRLLEEVSDFRLSGYYFGRPQVATGMPGTIYTWISGSTPAERQFLSRYLEMEYYMTSPEPSLRSLGGDGIPRFADEIRDETALEEICEVHRGILDYFGEWMALCGWERQLARLVGASHREAALWAEEQRRTLTAPEACRMYLASVTGDARQRYFDDWSGRQI